MPASRDTVHRVGGNNHGQTRSRYAPATDRRRCRNGSRGTSHRLCRCAAGAGLRRGPGALRRCVAGSLRRRCLRASGRTADGQRRGHAAVGPRCRLCGASSGADGGRDRQRQHAVPARFGARRADGAWLRNPLRHPPDPGSGAGHVRCPGAVRRRGAGERPVRYAAREPDPDPRRSHRRAGGAGRSRGRPGAGFRRCARGGARLGPDAQPHHLGRARLQDQSAAAAGRRDCRGGGLSRLAGGRQFHPARRARIQLPRKRRRRRSRGGFRARHSRRSRRQGAAARPRTRGDHPRDPGLPEGARSADRHQGQRQVPRPPPRPSRLCGREAVHPGRPAVW